MMKCIRLNTGSSMPLLGFGTYKIRGFDDVYRVVDAALTAGYRSFDTASVYQNEEDLGKCLKILLPQHDLSRQDIFITSKLAPRDQGLGLCRAACLQSIENLQCSYLDLYLIHWPGSQKLKPDDPKHKQNRLASWNDMIHLYKEGKVKAIGVSNFLEQHLEELISASEIIPAVLQIEFHPHLVQKKLFDWCQHHDVHFQAYSSLGTSAADNKLLNDPMVKTIADSLHKTTAQVLLRWAVQQNIGVLPKSTNSSHIVENARIFDFELSPEDMDRLSNLHSDTHYCWNPISIL